MKVAFWSNSRGVACNTTHLACVSIWHALINPMSKSVIFENHKSGCGIERMLYRPLATERQLYYRSGGLGALLRSISSGESPSMLEMDWMADRYIGERLLYFPIGADLGPEQLNFHLDLNLVDVLGFLEKRMNVVWMDLQTAAPTNRAILSLADVVVISLTQNRTSLERIFKNHRDIHEKSFYLLGNYDAESDLTIERISDEYRIPPERIAAIPHNAAFMDAISKGMLIPFLMRCFHCERDDVLYDFATTLGQVAAKVLGFVGAGEEENAYEVFSEGSYPAFVAGGGSASYGAYATDGLSLVCEGVGI